MPAFTLYTALGSSNGDRIRLTLAEGGFTDYETIIISLRTGEHKSQENMKRHPWGKIPSIETSDGLTLYESRSICKYIARKYSFNLIPGESNIEAMALFDQAESVEISYFTDAAAKLSLEVFAKKMYMGLPADEAVVANALKSLESFFDIIEQLLAQKPYMAGDKFTLIDIFYIPLVQRLFDCGYGDMISKRESFYSWWNRCISRPAIEKLLLQDRQAMAAMNANK